MLIRALIVLLLVLNLGVALWWATRAPQAAPPAPVPDPSVPQLQLVGEAAPAPKGDAASETAATRQCLSLGPFDVAAATRARARLQPHTLQLHERQQFSGTPKSWRVFLPAMASVEQAEAAASRVAEAGFQDYFVVREGDQANSLALGLYGNRDSALARIEALTAAGFPARTEPTGAGPVRYWLDLAVAAGVDIAQVQAQVEAEQRQALDCNKLPETPVSGRD